MTAPRLRSTALLGSVFIFCVMKRILNWLSRRKRWEWEVCEALFVARHAAAKLRAEMERGTVEPKAEYEELIRLRERLLKLPRGPKHYDSA